MDLSKAHLTDIIETIEYSLPHKVNCIYCNVHVNNLNHHNKTKKHIMNVIEYLEVEEIFKELITK